LFPPARRQLRGDERGQHGVSTRRRAGFPLWRGLPVLPLLEGEAGKQSEGLRTVPPAFVRSTTGQPCPARSVRLPNCSIIATTTSPDNPAPLSPMAHRRTFHRQEPDGTVRDGPCWRRSCSPESPAHVVDAANSHRPAIIFRGGLFHASEAHSQWLLLNGGVPL